MRKLSYLIILMQLFTFCSCYSQQKLTMQYLGRKSSGTQNRSYINNTFIFLRDKDTLLANVKVPFDTAKNEVINKGLYHNCLLTEGREYTITVKKIKPDNIPKGMSSYYKTNAIFSNKDKKSAFVETKLNTKYVYNGYYERYIDIDNILYEIVNITPNDECFLPH